MTFFDDMPLSLNKRANEVIDLPKNTWVGREPNEGRDLGRVGDNLNERLKVVIDYMYDAGTLEPGQLNKFLGAVENALVNYAANIIEIEEALQLREEESFFDPQESAKVYEIPGEE
jgi:hypothetical protein